MQWVRENIARVQWKSEWMRLPPASRSLLRSPISRPYRRCVLLSNFLQSAAISQVQNDKYSVKWTRMRPDPPDPNHNPSAPFSLARPGKQSRDGN